jgi:hypothetical protein
MKSVVLAAATLLLATSAWAQTGTKPVNIPAAENFYGDVARAWMMGELAAVDKALPKQAQ